MQSQLVDHFFVVGHRGVTIKHPDCIPGTFEEKGSFISYFLIFLLFFFYLCVLTFE